MLSPARQRLSGRDFVAPSAKLYPLLYPRARFLGTFEQDWAHSTAFVSASRSTFCLGERTLGNLSKHQQENRIPITNQLLYRALRDVSTGRFRHRGERRIRSPFPS